MNVRLVALLTVFTTFCLVAETIAMDWAESSAVESTDNGYMTTGPDPWLLSGRLEPPIESERFCLLIEVRAATATRMQFYWLLGDQEPTDERSSWLTVHPGNDFSTHVIDLGEKGTFKGADRCRLDPANRPGLQFDVKRIEFLRLHDVPAEFITQLIQFKCCTSRLHYQPGETIEYRAMLSARCYPDRISSKILTMSLLNESGRQLAQATHQYGLRPNLQFKEIQGAFDIGAPLKPGKYTLVAASRDQRSDLAFNARHVFAVQAPDDPFVCETPFKFVKDFSLIRDSGGRYHVFSITGDFFDGHAWMEDGQERTFSHASSSDLRHWEIHPPVISISDEKHPDGNEYFKNRNVWAPHVIEHDGIYWMFYTSVNHHVSQSVSLATSNDLFNWNEYEKNPVFTLENVEWANWRRDGWADCRDPAVLKDGNRFYLYTTANAKPPGECGAVSVAESDDLIHWRNAAIAVRATIISESPQVWKVGEKYLMTTSSHGAATWISDHPMLGWKKVEFPRPPIRDVERYVQTSGSYAEEVIQMPNGEHIMASMTFRHYGNSIYFFRIRMKDGIPIGYESPW